MAVMATPEDRAWFDGALLSILAYGAMCMLYLQLIQVFISRPTRDRKFWALVIYSTLLFPLASVAVGGLFRFAELAYVINTGGSPQEYISSHGNESIYLMSQICATLIPWIGDLLIIYRVYVIWNCCKVTAALPAALYVAQAAMSIPLLLSEAKQSDPMWKAKMELYATVFFALCVSLNLSGTLLIATRLVMQRKRVEQVMGRLHASFYTGWTTILVESGALYTAWGLADVIVMARHSSSHYVFLLPYQQISSITRMLIVLRMAQDRAWSVELSKPIKDGTTEADWRAASTHSIPLHDVPPSTTSSLPGKFRDDMSV